jgi:hypothetical protein
VQLPINILNSDSNLPSGMSLKYMANESVKSTVIYYNFHKVRKYIIHRSVYSFLTLLDGNNGTFIVLNAFILNSENKLFTIHFDKTAGEVEQKQQTK